MATLDLMDMNQAVITAHGFYCGGPRSGSEGWRPRPKTTEHRIIRSDSERTIYNKLGSTASAKGKVKTGLATYTNLFQKKCDS